jgi:hypothetical protein
MNPYSLYNIPLEYIDSFLIGSLGRMHSKFIEESVPGYESSRIPYDPGKVLVNRIKEYTFWHKNENLTLRKKVGAVIKEVWEFLSTLINTFNNEENKESLMPLVKSELQKLEPVIKDLEMVLLHRDESYDDYNF